MMLPIPMVLLALREDTQGALDDFPRVLQDFIYSDLSFPTYICTVEKRIYWALKHCAKVQKHNKAK